MIEQRIALEDVLFEVRRKIQPRAVAGRFSTWRWALVWATQLVFYGMPWLTWNDRPAILFDLAGRKFFVLGYVFWPQDFIYLTLLLVASALALFLFTAVAGRLWCGFACPQTVYTEIFLWLEARCEGDRAARLKLDAAPLTAAKVLRRGGKHAAWIAVALWTGFTFVGYFTPIRSLAGGIGTLTLGPSEAFWVGFYALATYGNAGWLREQVCKYMCPYARFQGALFDRDTLVIGYDTLRGEPRGRKADVKGDCVDCTLCVQVCPTGIDIRDGLQYECIGCGACLDACDAVMDKVGASRGLIRYSTENALAGLVGPATIVRRMVRPRTVVYAAILGVVVVATGLSLALRVPLKVDVIRDRGVLSRDVGSGEVENIYRLQVMNATEARHRYAISAEGLAGLAVASEAHFELEPAATRAVAVRLRAPREQLPPGSHPIHVSVQAVDDPSIRVREKAAFLLKAESSR